MHNRFLLLLVRNKANLFPTQFTSGTKKVSKKSQVPSNQKFAFTLHPVPTATECIVHRKENEAMKFWFENGVLLQLYKYPWFLIGQHRSVLVCLDPNPIILF